MKKTVKNAAAVCLAAMMSLSMSVTCFAGEWKDTADGKMYLDDNGSAVTGIQKIDDDTYYFSKKGIMQSGWYTDKNGNRFYFGSDGKMKKGGWLKTKGGKYYLTKSGAAVTGVKLIGKDYYHFNSKGLMLTGWQTSDGVTYYYEYSGKRAVNKTIKIDGERYRFGEDGTILTSQPSVTPESDEEVIYPTEIYPSTDEIPMRRYDRTFVVVNYKPINTTYKDVTYKSSDKSIIEITTAGEMYAKKKGTCTITVTSKHDSSVKFTVKVKVTEN
ncbi:MAG: Ig-like domain-containing protein [Ruminococcus sp.]|nr:Ig-like domain-containing protein [Ruminococcus sp.]